MWRRCAQELRERVGAERVDGWLVQEQVSGGTEMLLGVIRDAQLGLAVVLGAGGIATEVFGDTTVRLLPLGPADARAMLGELKCRVLLRGLSRAAAGRRRRARRRRSNALRRWRSRSAIACSKLRSIRCSCCRAGGGVVAADGLVVLAEEPAPSVEAATEAAAARRDSTGSKLAAT